MSLEVRRYLIYDGDCGICSASARWARNWDRAERYRIIPWQGVDPAKLQRLGVDPAACALAVQLVTESGEVLEGARAVNHFLSLRPVGRILVLPAARIPALLRLESSLYRLIARNRHRLSRWFGLDACQSVPGDNTFIIQINTD